MKITLIMVSSVDGKTTKWFDPIIYSWTSQEDQEHFYNTLSSAHLIIMGRKTYEAAKGSMKHTPDKLRVVLTGNPQAYTSEAIPEQLEFSNETPAQLIKRLEEKGYTEALLVGGSHTNTEFFKAHLVNELMLTLEPKLFGEGNGIISEEELHVNIELTSIEKLNSSGTLLLKYAVK